MWSSLRPAYYKQSYSAKSNYTRDQRWDRWFRFLAIFEEELEDLKA